MSATNSDEIGVPTWDWSQAGVFESGDGGAEGFGVRQRVPGTFWEGARSSDSFDPHGHGQQQTERNPGSTEPQSSKPNDRPPRTYESRQCRICLEVIQPTWHPPSNSLPGILQGNGHVTYESEDPSSGRLLSPCKCIGTARFVHEGCLQEWRYSQNAIGTKNYWECHTCHYRYRLQRMAMARMISSVFTQLGLTVLIFLFAMFLMGFVADPVLNLYIDPFDTITTGSFTEPALTEGPSTWFEHFLKGLASLGLLGFAKVFVAMSPWNMWNFRHAIFGGGGGRRNEGRDRMTNTFWVVVLVGIGTFLYAVWKGVRLWSRRFLEKRSEQVMNIPPQDKTPSRDDEADQDEKPSGAAPSN